MPSQRLVPTTSVTQSDRNGGGAHTALKKGTHVSSLHFILFELLPSDSLSLRPGSLRRPVCCELVIIQSHKYEATSPSLVWFMDTICFIFKALRQGVETNGFRDN